MNTNVNKLVLIGAGNVGLSFVYACMNQAVANEIVIIDINTKRAEGEAMDLNHGVCFAPANMSIYSGGYEDAKDADIAVIAAGVSQKPGQDRLSLLIDNARIFKQIIDNLKDAGFSGIILVASNPVDIMSYITFKLSGFDSRRVIGSGTTLDTARLRFMLGDYFKVDPHNVHAYVMGEHGDSEFVPWSQAVVGTKPVFNIINENPIDYSYCPLQNIAYEVKNSAYKIIEAKGATYYGIGMALTRIIKAIYGGENSILTVSAFLSGEYGIDDIYLGVPAVINREGVREIVSLSLDDFELEQLWNSAQVLKKATEPIIKQLTIEN